MNQEFYLLTHIIAKQRGHCSSASLLIEGYQYDEEILIKYAREHKLSTSLFSAVSTQRTLLSQNAYTRLKKIITEENVKRSFMQHVWKSLYSALTAQKITPLIIKGPFISLQLYDSPYIREYTDLDLVVPSNQLESTIDCMQKLGYILESDISCMPSISSRNKFVQKINHLVFSHEGYPYRIEVHTSVFGEQYENTSYSTQHVISRSVLIVFQGITYIGPSLQDHLLLLIMHGSKHAWMLLHWLIDMVVACTIEDQKIHNDVARGISELGLKKKTALMVTMIKEFFDSPIPASYWEIYEKYHDHLIPQIEISKKRLISSNQSESSISKIIRFSWKYQMPLANSNKERIKIFFRPFMISPQDLKRVPLPDSLLFLHIIIRPIFVLERRIKRRWISKND